MLLKALGIFLTLLLRDLNSLVYKIRVVGGVVVYADSGNFLPTSCQTTKTMVVTSFLISFVFLFLVVKFIQAAKQY